MYTYAFIHEVFIAFICHITMYYLSLKEQKKSLQPSMLLTMLNKFDPSVFKFEYKFKNVLCIQMKARW